MIPRPSTHSKALGPGVTGPELCVPTSAPLERPPQPQAQFPLSGAAPFMVDLHTASDPHQHTKMPYVTGTSVLAIKFAGGVLLAADTLAAYGTTKRYKSTERMVRVNDRVAIAASGEISDFQYILTLLDELTSDDYRADDGLTLGPSEVYAYLVRVLYNRRNKMDPLWNTLVIGGVEADGTSFLGMVSMVGTHYTDSHAATGFGNSLARPLMREKQRDDMSEEDAIALMHECLRVCYYRDKISINKFQITKVTPAGGVTVSEPFSLDMRWDYKLFARPTQWAIGAW